MIINPWMRGAAEISLPDDNDEGGSVYPDYRLNSTVQGSSSTYAGRDFSSSVHRSSRPQLTVEEINEQVAHEKLISELVYYLLVKMEPTDRCLRLPGDVFDPERLKKEGSS